MVLGGSDEKCKGGFIRHRLGLQNVDRGLLVGTQQGSVAGIFGDDLRVMSGFQDLRPGNHGTMTMAG